jgi:hypothetical protein
MELEMARHVLAKFTLLNIRMTQEGHVFTYDFTSINSNTSIIHSEGGGRRRRGGGGEDKGVRAWKDDNTCTPRQLSRRRGRPDM